MSNSLASTFNKLLTEVKPSTGEPPLWVPPEEVDRKYSTILLSVVATIGLVKVNEK